MRNAFYIPLLAAVTLLASACKKEGLITYNASNNIYFNYRAGVDSVRQQIGTIVDSLDFTFAYSANNVTDTLFPIPIAVTGAPAEQDRTYKVAVDPGATAIEGQHYAFTSLVVKAGRVIDTMFVSFKRATGLRQGKVAFTLHLQPNENFDTELRSRSFERDTVNTLTLKITLTDMLVAGPEWDIYYARYFGAFSEKKMRLMNQVVGLPLDFWATEGGVTSTQIAEAIYYCTTMGRYLRQQAAAGNTIYEEDGVTPMLLGPDYQ